MGYCGAKDIEALQKIPNGNDYRKRIERISPA
jgi:hypothetical protein